METKTKDDLLRTLKEQDFSDEIILAFSKVPREKFIRKDLEYRAYEDIPLPIGFNQTISQPSTIAIMLQFLDLKEENQKQKILEIGSGCGYVLALISTISPKSEIYGVERLKEIAEASRINLKDYKNVKVYNKDGSKGLNEHTPYDRIIISAECEIDTVKALSDQLKTGGIIVAPIVPKNSIYSYMNVFEKTKKGLIKKTESLGSFMFVPLIGD
jgi:protein-L-isoaspartate(D-aspartate) O-methyltransferase